MFRFLSLRWLALPLVTFAALIEPISAQAGTIVIESGGVTHRSDYYDHDYYDRDHNNNRIYYQSPSYYRSYEYPNYYRRDSWIYRSPGHVIRGDIDDSTIVNPVIVGPEIEDSTIVNPVIVPGRAGTRTIIRERPHDITNPACMAYSSMRVACQ